jgi:ABC-type phosphate transport system auxiliary subunit
MALVDWFDLFMHGAPWLWLVGSTVTLLRKRSAAAIGGLLPLLVLGLRSGN